jgi:putative membrane protein
MTSQRHPCPPRRSFALAAALLSITLACATDDAAARRDSIVAAAEEAYAASHRASTPRDTADTTVRRPAAITDNNILARVAQDDRLELQVARTALPKLTSPALRAFAREIADNHSAGESDARRLSQRLKLPEQPAVSDTTKAHQQNLVALFTRLNKGLTFDTTYVRHLLDGHSTMLRELKTMEEKATHPEVKALLRNATPEVQRHLARASALGKAIMAGRT